MKHIESEISQLAETLKGKAPRIILREALSRYESIALSFSGAEDVVLIDLAVQIRPDIQVFTLDTGRLHSETHQLIEAVRKKYPIRLEVLTPRHDVLEPFVREKGLFSFFEDGHTECCSIRKVEPLRRKLDGLTAWVTGQRRDQNPTRSELAEVEIDRAFSREDHVLVKFNPLANWTSAQVWDYIEAYDVPYNELHRHGFVSIGCEPCTRAVLPNQHERMGRWWWEDSAKKECGLHAGNLK